MGSNPGYLLKHFLRYKIIHSVHFFSSKRSVNRQDVQVIQFLVSVNSKGKAKEEGA